MSRNPNSLHDPQPSRNQQGVAARHLRQDQSISDTDTIGHQETAGTAETSSTALGDNSLSGLTAAQRAGVSTPSDGSISPLYFDPPPSAGSTLRRISPFGRLKHHFEELRQNLRDVPPSGERRAGLPTPADFPHSVQVQIVPQRTRKAIKHVVVVLHHFGGSEASLVDLALDLNEQQPETSYVLLRGLEAVPTPNSGYHWADPASEWDGGFLRASEAILVKIIKSSLIARCGFSPRDILLLGHGQGGMAALATAALWEDVELGGVVSIGGPLPSYVHSATSTRKIQTPALALGGSLGDLSPHVLNCIKSRFAYTDICIRTGIYDTVPEDEESMAPLLAFLAHRLRREEWMQQAVLSFGKLGLEKATYYRLIVT